MTDLQLALDFLSQDEAAALAAGAAGLVDLVEAGTPLLKRYGVGVLGTLRTAAPACLLVADLKTMDAGAFEATMAFDAGADVVTTLVWAGDNTIRAMVQVAHQRAKRVMVDLMGVSDPVSQLPRLLALNVDALCLHLGADDQKSGADPLLRVAAVRQHLHACGGEMTIAVAGGLGPRSLDQIQGRPELMPDIVIVGSAITSATDPQAAAADMRRRIDSLKMSN